MKDRYFAFFSPSSQPHYFAIPHEKEEVQLLIYAWLALTIQASQEKEKSGILEN